jgi:hypothetical protein
LAAASARRPGAGQQADAFQFAGDILDAIGLGQVHRQAQRTQPGHRCRRVAALPAEDQVGLEGDDGFQIERMAAHPGQNLGCRRVVAVLRRADHPVSRSGGEQQFGDVRRQTYDAPGRRRQPDASAAGVGDDNFAPRRQADQRAQQRQAQSLHAARRITGADFSPPGGRRRRHQKPQHAVNKVHGIIDERNTQHSNDGRTGISTGRHP